MKSSINTDLIYDLARLARRYPPEDWETILRWLNDEDSRKQMINLFQEIRAMSSQQRKKTSGLRGASRIPGLLEEIKTKDPAKGTILSDFWRKLRNRELLTKVSNIRMFADIVGLQAIHSTKRDQAIGELMRQLIDLPRDKVESALQKASVAPRNFGDEYERWVTLILANKPDRPKEETSVPQQAKNNRPAENAP